MNLQPAKKHESITILLVPHNGYSAFLPAVDGILRETRLPFELIIVEGCAPDPIRHELEKRQARRKNIKIIYSNHRPRLAQAFNLGLPHIRTRRAFLMHNDLRVTPQWLENLLQHATGKPGVFSPYVATAHNDGGLHKEAFETDMHGLLVDKETLALLGEFDEKVASPLLSLDFSHWLKKHGIPAHKEPYTVLEHVFQSPKSLDMKLFQRQWDEKQLRESLAYLNEKWGLKLQEAKYMGLLQKLKRSQPKKAASAGGQPWQELPMRQEFPKLSLKKFLQVLIRA